jgi:glutamine synthetase
MDKQRDFVLRTIEERGIKFIRLWFTDVVGTLKSVAIAPAEVEGAFAEGLGFDGSAIEGLTRSYEADVLAHPDPATFQILPWRGEIDPTARMFCDIMTPDGQPAIADPRNVLKRTLAKAADAGFTFYTHPEVEFYLLKSSKFGVEGPRARRRCRLLRQRARRHRPRLPSSLRPDARGPRHLGGVQPPRGRAGAERDRPPLRGCAHDGR